MSGFQYNSPIDFRISQDVPDISDASPQVQSAIQDLYSFSNSAIMAFTQYCGIGPRNYSSWSNLAANSSTLLAGNLNRLYIIADAALNFGDVINLYKNATDGTLHARLANATDNTKPADGFVSMTNIAAGAVGEVQLHTGVILLTGLTVGQRYWLSTTDGLIANAPATASGNIEQYIGIAIDSTHLFANIGYWIQH